MAFRLTVRCGRDSSFVDAERMLAGCRQTTIAIAIGRQVKNFPWHTPRNTGTPRIWISLDCLQNCFHEEVDAPGVESLDLILVRREIC
jgi:hypothetical protein